MSKDYWIGRAAQRELESQVIASKYLAQMDARLRETQRDIIREIESFYGRYAKDNKITLREAKLLLTRNELMSFNMDLKKFRELSMARNPLYEQILNESSYRVRISRLEALNLKVEMQMAELYGGANGLQQYTYTGLADVYENSYYKTMFDIAKAGVEVSAVAAISDETMKEVLSYNWSGKEFSDSVWGHQEATRNVIRDELKRSFSSGRSIQQTTKAIVDRTDVVRSRAEALVRTESNFFHGLASQNSYVDAEIERYEILATLDTRTSETCRFQDGKIYKTKDYKPGVNANPFHVRCRTTTVPWFDESEHTAQERRQSENGLIKSMNFEEWFDKYVG